MVGVSCVFSLAVPCPDFGLDPGSESPVGQLAARGGHKPVVLQNKRHGEEKKKCNLRLEIGFGTAVTFF